MAQDLKAPLWGSYSKKYMGISRIIEDPEDEGARFDFIPHPTLWNSATPVPNVTVPSSYHPWESAPDFSYYSYRYELMWKDRVYADVSFSKINNEAYLMRCGIFNETELSQNCVLNLFSSLEFPFYEKIEVLRPPKSILVSANDYEKYEYKRPRPWDGENPDGMFKGMFRDGGFYKACGLGDRVSNSHVKFYGFKPFGCENGDTVSYKINAAGFKNPVLAVRYKTVTDGDALFSLNGKLCNFPHCEKLDIIYIPFCENPEFVSLGDAGIELDFLCVIEEGERVEIKKTSPEYKPEIKTDELENGKRINLYYANGCRFCVLTSSKNTRLRTLESGSLEDALINRLSNGDFTYDDLTETFSNSFKRKKSDPGFFQNTLVKSIFIEPNTSHIEYAVVSKGKFEPLQDEEYEEIYKKRRKNAFSLDFNGEGQRYALSSSILGATLLTNAVYPVYLHGKNTVHYTPGKRWDSFYTWDSGIIGAGLLEFSSELCEYTLEQYTCDEKNRDFAFLLHGSLVPTQFAQYLELLKRTEDKGSLNYLYARMKRYYEFILGRADGSTFGKFNNGLLTSYDYWYSCSGMDDYPAQSEMIKNHAEEYTCPCITTSFAIMAAKIMKMAAAYLGRLDDINTYDSDIKKSSKALNTLAWDEKSGYYGYTLYDKNKDRPYIMKTKDGENFNKGMDGVYPLFAGAVDDEKRKERLLSHLKSPREMWSDAGISAVDMSASYYFDDGYWNGNVWMSHQWFAFKAMLDMGDTDFAFEIADRALEMWREETDFSYYTYECFGIKTRRGGWFHNFGGLSAPIVIWACAYYRPGTVTSGFDLWTDYQKTDGSSAEIAFKYFGKNEKYSIIVTLSDKNNYSVTLDGEEIPFYERKKGCIEITLDSSVRKGVIKCKIK